MSELRLESSLIDERYELLERKGQGSYAEIFVARDRMRDNKLVIVKALNTHLQGTPDPDLEQTLIENFKNEAIALDTVRHPNIISLLGGGTAVDLSGQFFHYIVLEYMPGGDLLQRCRQRPLSFDEMMYYIGQVCDALSHAHQCGIIHRDIKPNNLLLSADGKTVKIADFGVAKISPRANEEVTRVGTDVYAPPEHHPITTTGELVEPAQLTPSADIYSLAKTIYTLLSGQAPRQFARKPISELPPGIRNGKMAEGLLAVLCRATDSQIDKRYASATAFYRELEAVQALDAEATHVRPRADRGAMPPAPPLPEFVMRAAASDRGPSTGDAKIVIQLPQRSPSVDQQEEKKDEIVVAPDEKVERADKGTAAKKKKAGAKPGFWERADNLIFVHRKKILAMWALVLFLGLSFWVYTIFQPSSLEDPSRFAVVIRDVSVRTGPGTEWEPVGWLGPGARLRILQRDPKNWYQVEILDPNDQKTARTSRGWVYGSYIQTAFDSR